MAAAVTLDALPEASASTLPGPARRIGEHFDRIGLPYAAKALAEVPATPEDLAEALGVSPDEIAETSIYRGKATRKPVLLLHSATTRVSDKVLSQLVGENINRADAAFALAYSGFDSHCVPPVAHLNRLPILMDSALTRLPRVVVSLGAPGVYATVPTLVLARVIAARLVRLVA